MRASLEDIHSILLNHVDGSKSKSRMIELSFILTSLRRVHWHDRHLLMATVSRLFAEAEWPFASSRAIDWSMAPRWQGLCRSQIRPQESAMAAGKRFDPPCAVRYPSDATTAGSGKSTLMYVPSRLSGSNLSHNRTGPAPSRVYVPTVSRRIRNRSSSTISSTPQMGPITKTFALFSLRCFVNSLSSVTRACLCFLRFAKTT